MMESLNNLTKSKKFWAATIYMIFIVVVEFAPGLEENANQLQETALYIIGMLIGGWSLQDGAQAFSTGLTKYDSPDMKHRIKAQQANVTDVLIAQSAQQPQQPQPHDHEYHG